jgi:hypothetical protein
MNINEILTGISKELKSHYKTIDFSNYGIIDENVVSMKLVYQNPIGEPFTGKITVMDPITFTPKEKYVENRQQMQTYMIRAVVGKNSLDIRSILEVGSVLAS